MRPDTAPLDTLVRFHELNTASSNSRPIWQPTGSVKQQKSFCSHNSPSQSKPSQNEILRNSAGIINEIEDTHSFDRSLSDFLVTHPSGASQEVRRCL